MNHLLLIKEKIKRAKKLKDAQLLATKRGEFIEYKFSTYVNRQKEAKMDLKN